MRHVPVLGGLLGVVALSPLVPLAPLALAWAASQDAGPAGPETSATRPAGDTSATLTAAYRGVRIPVPAGWPVYRLHREPSRCVRLDRRAVYLGTPGPRAHCPSRLIGGADVLHVMPASGPASGRPGRPVRGRDLPGAGTDTLARFTVRPTVDHQVRLPLRAAGVTITGSYGSGPSTLQALIRGIEITRPWPPSTGDRAEDGEHDGDRDDRDEKPWTGGDPRDREDDEPPAGEEGGKGGDPEPKVAAEQNWVIGKGFDTCTAPPVSAMRAWRRSFRVSNVYIGGAARGCAQPNLTRKWVKSVRAMGYRLIPTYVGLQAPCGRYRAEFTAANAAVEGRKAALDAVRKARSLGVPERKPIYFDIEAYPQKDVACRKAVLTFLHNWTVKLKQKGYVPGVYGSVASAVQDLVRAKGIARPHSIWFAHWDGNKALYGHPSIPDELWHPHRRIKQYRGGHKETHGGVTINIDSNNVDGRVY